jgi:SAM-dependent methyltransferase
VTSGSRSVSGGSRGGGPAAAALARYYDLDLRDDPGDVTLYQALADRTGGPVLELGVGSGRIAVPLALDGHAVTGVDNEPAMLARADAAWRERRSGTAGTNASGTLRLVEGDLTSVRLNERFGLAILALNTLMLLDDGEQQVAALRTLAAHLRPDGLAVVDVWLPGPEDLSLYDGRLLLEWVRGDPETGEQVAKLASARYDSATATVTLTQLFDSWGPGRGPVERIARTDQLRLVAASELVRMAAEAGLAVEALAGDHQMAAFGPGEERAILLGRLV